MPKPLSLKKAHATVPPKNQKSITQFFKNTNAASTQNQHKSPAKNKPSQINGQEKKVIKRKACSPVILETIEIDDEDSINFQVSCSNSLKNGNHTPKKFKSDHETVYKSSKKTVGQKSPEKENISKLSTENGTDKSAGGSTTEAGVCIDEDINRSPLTPVKVHVNGENSSRLGSNKILNQESNGSETENHVQSIERKSLTPKKVLNFDSCSEDIINGFKKENTPNKSPGKGLSCLSRLAVLKTPEKLSVKELSPSKSGSTVKTVEFSPNTLDGFGDQWDVDDVDENITEDLDLTTMQRCEVLSVTRHPGRVELRLKNDKNNRGTCFVEGVWLDTPLSPGETISVIATKNPAGHFSIGNGSGLLTLRPDHLISSTSVVGGVFCRRKAVLQERFKGLDSGNTAMVIGILVHELVQKALTENILDSVKLQMEMDKVIKESIQMLYSAGLSEEEARTNMAQYIRPLVEFMETYVAKSPLSKQPQKDQWKGHIDKVLDIEENLCCPQLGLKGKIDATLQVTIHKQNGRQKSIVPLELKSGKASVSAEHRGQLVLYGMMLTSMRGDDPSTADNSGLLLYLKERVDVREVSCGYPERRDLLMLRNQLAQYLATGPKDINPEELTDIEELAVVRQQLPEPIHHHACSKCAYLTLCQLYLWNTEGPSVSDSHPLSKLKDTALGHLNPAHIEYFLKWDALLRVEERGQTPLHPLWTLPAEQRSKRGTCAANVKLKSVEPSDGRYLHSFERQIKEIDTLNANSKCVSGPQEGDFSTVSVGARPWLAAGVVTRATHTQIQVLLERDLSRRLSKDTLFHIDTYESYATTVHNLTNLGVLMEDTEKSARLRRLIIDKEPPEFEEKLRREVGRLGSKLMRGLNIQQQRAVLRALAAKDYHLLRGLPGTGKTQTISVLIQMLVGLKQRVLVTAHTHSAVDTVLSRLPETMKILRLGSSSRVADGLKSRCEAELVAKCENVKQLEELYKSMEVVGVTCLGASHPVLTRTRFDVCIVDEATQVLQSSVLRPLFAADRIVVVGDPDQLPPVVRSQAARRLGMEESLFHRLMTSEATSTLQLQYRMNQTLTDIANKVAYNYQLKCADQNVAQAKLDVNVKLLSAYPSWLQSACSPVLENAGLFLDMAFDNVEGKHCTNVGEACVILAIVEALLLGAVKPSNVGVIAPYRDQVNLLRRGLSHRNIECSTVDQYQGRDKPVILYSCTRREGQDDAKVKEGEILNDQRRLAVAVTRAKHKLLVVGNSRALHRYTPLQTLIHACKTVHLQTLDFNTVINKYRKEFV